MFVIMLEWVSTGLRGKLTRWLLEPRTAVFVGRVSALVPGKPWERICGSAMTGGAILVHTADTQQGFAIRLHGEPRRSVRDFEGLSLVPIP